MKTAFTLFLILLWLFATVALGLIAMVLDGIDWLKGRAATAAILCAAMAIPGCVTIGVNYTDPYGQTFGATVKVDEKPDGKQVLK